MGPSDSGTNSTNSRTILGRYGTYSSAGVGDSTLPGPRNWIDNEDVTPNEHFGTQKMKVMKAESTSDVSLKLNMRLDPSHFKREFRWRSLTECILETWTRRLQLMRFTTRNPI